MSHNRRLGITLAILAFVSPLVNGQDRTGPFTHAPRSVRSLDLDQRHVRLELNFNWDKQQIVGRATHTLVPYKPLRSIKLNAADMQIKAVTLVADKMQVLKHTTKRNSLDITLDREYGPHDEIKIAIDYVVTRPEFGAHFVVPDKNEPTQPKMVWTQSEDEYARYWFPCVDTPADRLTSEIVATVPEHFYVLSNGTLISKRKDNDGTQTWHWSQKKDHVPYLLSVVAGEFEVFEQEWQSIPIQSFVPKGRLADAARSFEKTQPMMDFFSRKIGYKYPWSKYAQICVDEYQWGGMEHTSATTLNISTLHDQRAHLDVSSDNLVAHELVHQWFGDLMTCKDWAELWLNESFATYFATLWTEEDLGWEEATWARHVEANNYKGEDKRYRRPMVTYRYNRPGNMFDGHSYPKGARILHMLRYELGDALFWRAINRYTTVNQFRSVETADFRIAVERATGQSMTWFFDQWIHHGGHPDFEVAWDWDDRASTVRLTVKQTQKVDTMTPLFRTKAEIELVTPGKTTIERITLSKADETFHFKVAQRPTRVCFDPQDWLLKTLKFEKGKEELLDQLANDKHLICRHRAAKALAEFSKHDDVRDALIRATQQDSFWAIRKEATTSLAKFKGDPVRKALLTAARTDEKSFVRREAIKSLGQFAHDDTRKVLRQIVEHDASYYAVAESLKALVKIDRKNCADDLLKALSRDSHREEILKAATNGLVTLKDSRAESQLRDILTQSLTPAKRVVVIGALARLKPEDHQTRELLAGQLADNRRNVRQSAIDAMVALADVEALDALQSKRNTEKNHRVIKKLDEAIKKVQEKQNDSEKLRKEVESLRKQNRSLEERIRKLEQK